MPDQRFGQLVCNAVGEAADGDPTVVSDADLLVGSRHIASAYERGGRVPVPIEQIGAEASRLLRTLRTLAVRLPRQRLGLLVAALTVAIESTRPFDDIWDAETAAMADAASSLLRRCDDLDRRNETAIAAARLRKAAGHRPEPIPA